MALSPSTIKPARGSKRHKRRVGRGNASTKGTFASRGLKGQRARSGGKSRTQIRGFKQSLLKVPKRRGFNAIKQAPATVTLAMINRIFSEGDTVSPWTLDAVGAISAPQFGVKIVAKGKLEKKLTVQGCIASKAALAAIESSGSTFVA